MAHLQAFVAAPSAASSSAVQGPPSSNFLSSRPAAYGGIPKESSAASSIAAVGAGVLAAAAVAGSSRKASERRNAGRRVVACEATKTRRQEERVVFPFCGIIGQKEMKLALILNVIDPKVGGVMILGDRGTGKTTTIRALVDLLPEISCVADDPYNSSPDEFDAMSDEVRVRKEANEEMPVSMRKVPMVDLPLGATEDRVCGTIDIEKALTQGKKAFEPGLLAKANRGILYVDEVNLLDDHLVDVLLDSAAGGWNTVEREGISIRHPAKFILVGSGNPEEGDLRPQLLDRFGMHAMIRTEPDPELRVQIVEGCQEFANDPKGYRASFVDENTKISEQIVAARKILGDVTMPDDLKVKISEVCSALNVDGLRGDIVTNRAARAYTAYMGRTEVTEDDVKKVITLCLRHRLRKDVLDTMDNGDKVEKTVAKVFGDEE